MRPSATSVCGLKLLVYAALRHAHTHTHTHTHRFAIAAQAFSCVQGGLKLLVYEAFSY